MAKKSGGYFGMGWIVSLILAIIPFTNIILGIITRAKAGNVLGIILNIFLAPVFYVIDLITIIVANKITVLA